MKKLLLSIIIIYSCHNHSLKKKVGITGNMTQATFLKGVDISSCYVTPDGDTLLSGSKITENTNRPEFYFGNCTNNMATIPGYRYQDGNYHNKLYGVYPQSQSSYSYVGYSYYPLGDLNIITFGKINSNSSHPLIQITYPTQNKDIYSIRGSDTKILLSGNIENNIYVSEYNSQTNTALFNTIESQNEEEVKYYINSQSEGQYLLSKVAFDNMRYVPAIYYINSSIPHWKKIFIEKENTYEPTVLLEDEDNIYIGGTKQRLSDNQTEIFLLTSNENNIYIDTYLIPDQSRIPQFQDIILEDNKLYMIGPQATEEEKNQIWITKIDLNTQQSTYQTIQTQDKIHKVIYHNTPNTLGIIAVGQNGTYIYPNNSCELSEEQNIESNPYEDSTYNITISKEKNIHMLPLNFSNEDQSYQLIEENIIKEHIPCEYRIYPNTTQFPYNISEYRSTTLKSKKDHIPRYRTLKMQLKCLIASILFVMLLGLIIFIKDKCCGEEEIAQPREGYAHPELYDRGSLSIRTAYKMARKRLDDPGNLSDLINSQDMDKKRNKKKFRSRSHNSADIKKYLSSGQIELQIQAYRQYENLNKKNKIRLDVIDEEKIDLEQELAELDELDMSDELDIENELIEKNRNSLKLNNNDLGANKRIRPKATKEYQENSLDSVVFDESSKSKSDPLGEEINNIEIKVINNKNTYKVHNIKNESIEIELSLEGDDSIEEEKSISIKSSKSSTPGPIENTMFYYEKKPSNCKKSLFQLKSLQTPPPIQNVPKHIKNKYANKRNNQINQNHQKSYNKNLDQGNENISENANRNKPNEKDHVYQV